MKLIRIIFCFVLLIGCKQQEEEASFRSLTNNQAEVQKDLAGVNAKQVSNSDTNTISEPGINHKQAIKYVYFTDYGNKVDSRKQTLKIAENIITFFIQNENHAKLIKFRNKGFPMEFWGTEGYSFFALPYAELENKIAIARDLGYPDFGYKCTLISDALTEEKILTAWIKIKFKDGTPHDVVQQLISDSDFIEKRLLTNQSYQLKLKNQKPSSMIKQFRTLRKNDNIEKIEFIF